MTKALITKKVLIENVLLTLFLFFFFYIGDFFFNILDVNIFIMFVFWFVSVTVSRAIIKLVFRK